MARAIVPDEDLFVISSLPPGRAQKRLALAVVLALLVTFFLTAGPLSHIWPGRISAFVPAYATAMFSSEMITAVLLFSQFSILPTRALLVMATGYLFTALMVIPWVLTFPGVFVPAGLIGGLQTRPYVYFFWHAGFPAFVIAYAFLKEADFGKRYWHGSIRAAIALSVIVTASIIAAATMIFATENAILPGVQVDILHVSPLFLYLGAPTAALVVLAILALWLRRRSILDLWLMVVMCAYAIEICLDYYPFPGVYSFGWYASRIFGLFSSSLVLLVLLFEIINLYARLVLALHAQRRERDARLVTGDAVAATIAHEVKQPLAGMITSADAGFRFLDRATPDLEEAKAAFRQIATDGHRAGAVIGSIRTIFKPDGRNRTPLDLNDLIAETLAVVREDLKKNRILVETKLDEGLPQVMGDRIQLQQVLVNLIANAIDAMSAVHGLRILSVKSGRRADGDVTVSVADTGTGIDSQHMDRIFNPLFTTKSEGMGMGLSICRSIVEAHEGRLWAARNEPRGAIFHFTAAGAVSA